MTRDLSAVANRLVVYFLLWFVRLFSRIFTFVLACFLLFSLSPVLAVSFSATSG